MQKTITLKRSSSFYFFTKPSFVEGMARVLDLGRTLQTQITTSSPAQTDMEAIGNDWKIVGEDIKNSINIYAQKQPTNAR